MNELIKVEINENQEPVISGRELHKALEVTERYSSWFERMTQYGFTENYDFTSVKSFTLVNNGANRELEDHILKLDMAKEISMIQNKKGRSIRIRIETLVHLYLISLLHLIKKEDPLE